MSKITIKPLEITPEEKQELHKAFQNGCGRRRSNILAKDDKIELWLKNGWIERRKDQPIEYYELIVF